MKEDCIYLGILRLGEHEAHRRCICINNFGVCVEALVKECLLIAVCLRRDPELESIISLVMP